MPGLSSDAIKVLSRSVQTQQGNLSGVGAFGQKRFEEVFVDSRAGTKSQGSSFITSQQRTTIDIQGQINGTGINSDIAIEGKGMFVVRSAPTSKESVFTRRGDFRQDELGYWKNGANQLLFAWKLDTDGQLPVNSSTLGSLEAVNFANTKGSPKATTSISMAMNLNAKKDALRGAGPQLVMRSTGLNSGTGKTNKDDIIVPEFVQASYGLTIGDTFTLKSEPSGNVEKIVEYGGIAMGRAVTNTNQLFGAKRPSDQFTFGTGPNQVNPNGAELQITVGDEVVKFEATSSAPNSKNKQFNSINTLVDAINNTARLKARLDKDGVLYIAATENFIDKEITFSSTGTDFAGALGLDNIPESAPNVKRFNSLSSLERAINADQTTNALKAKITDQKIDITALDPLSKMTFTAESLGEHRFSHATLGDGSEKGRATVKISAPNSGLQTGDLVMMKGLSAYGTQLSDGIYAVGNVDKGSGFEIYLVCGNAGAATDPGNGIDKGLQAAAPGRSLSVNNGTWQKIPGGNAAKNDKQISGSDTANKTVDITHNNHGLISGDVVLIQGGGKYNDGTNDITLPDGYYVITVSDANKFQINKAAAVVANAGVLVKGLSYYKVGATQAAGTTFDQANGINTFDSKPVFETVANVDSVKLNMPNNDYNVGDYISFKGLPAAYAIGNLPVANDTRYKIIERTDDYVKFEIVRVGGPAATAATGSYKTGALPALGPDFRVNNASRTLEYFGIDKLAKGENGDQFEKSYDPTDISKSLSGAENLGLKVPAFKPSEIFSQTLRAFDSLGVEFNLQIRFAKLDANQWAVEVAADADVATNRREGDGLLASGTIVFDENGVFKEALGIDGQIQVDRGGISGAGTSFIRIDWENSAGQIKSGTASQFGRDESFEFTQQDGQAAGTLTNIEVDPDGYVLGTFDSGEIRKLYKLAIATFPNMNGLTPESGGTYRISRESGELLLKGANTPGAGRLVGGALELSNTDTTTELLTVKERSLQIQANARVIGVQSQDQKTILSETQ